MYPKTGARGNMQASFGNNLLLVSDKSWFIDVIGCCQRHVNRSTMSDLPDDTPETTLVVMKVYG